MPFTFTNIMYGLGYGIMVATAISGLIQRKTIRDKQVSWYITGLILVSLNG